MTRGAATVAKIKGHWGVVRKLWSVFESVAIPAIIRGAPIFIGWPRNCAYGKEREVVAFFDTYDFKFTEFDGCMYGLVAKHGPNRGSATVLMFTLLVL
eukprot:5535670-Heterocapsa_arctica.AAC.1